MSDENTEAGITSPIGSVSLKGKKTAEFIAIFCLSLLLLLSYILWEHKAEAKESSTSISQAMRDIAISNRVLACLMATAQEQREAKLAQCERIAR